MLVNHQIAGGKVGIRTELLTALVLGFSYFSRSGADALRQLSLRQHRQLQLGPLASRAERAQGNTDAALRGQLLQLRRVHRLDAPLPQEAHHVVGPHLAAAQHHHTAAHGKMLMDISRRRVQRPAVGAHLLRRYLQQLLGF